jgi:hypothetical protein
MTLSGQNLEELLNDDDDEVKDELSVIFTKKDKVYIITPEINSEGVNQMATMLAHLVIHWAHSIAEKMEAQKTGMEIPTIKVGLPK